MLVSKIVSSHSISADMLRVWYNNHIISTIIYNMWRYDDNFVTIFWFYLG